MDRRTDSVSARNVPSPRTTQLRLASEQLASVLESLELETEAELANEVVDAIIAIERAYEIDTADRRVPESSNQDESSPVSATPSQFGDTFIYE